MPPPPNILLITSDQHRWDCFGFEGRRIRTPWLDRMAAAGTRFSAAITPKPGVPAGARVDPDRHAAADPRRLRQLRGPRRAHRRARLGTASRRCGLCRQVRRQGPFRRGPGCDPLRRAGEPRAIRRFSRRLVGSLYGLRRGRADDPRPLARLAALREAAARPAFRTLVLEPGRRRGVVAVGGGCRAAARSGADLVLPACRISGTRPPGSPSAASPSWRGAIPTGPFCLWVSYPDPHHPFDCPEPWSRLHGADTVDISATPRARPRAPAVVAPGGAGERAPGAQRAIAHPAQGIQPDRAADRPPARRDDGQLLWRDRLHRSRRPAASWTGWTRSESRTTRSRCSRRTTANCWATTAFYLKGPTPYEGLLRVGLIARGPGVPARRVVADPVVDRGPRARRFATTPGSTARTTSRAGRSSR